jgi:3-hydroxy-9,10-secoandrosta-1,3,5(10)-triene-9,17-dione monooxygenase
MNDTTAARHFANGHQVLERTLEISRGLTARGAAAEKAGRLPEETIREIVDAGIMTVCVPSRFGGLELDYEAIPQISRLLGRGCLASAWTIGILLQHNMQMGLFSERAQEDFWSKGPSSFAPGFIIPGGTAKRVEGGWTLSGHWRFGSGYPQGDWILLSAHEETEGRKGRVMRFALPVGDTTPKNNWDVSGLAGTGTWDCLLDGVFVPEHRSMPASSMLDGTAPGMEVNKGPLWRIPMLSFYYPNMSAMVLGAAEGVANMVLEKMKARVLAYGGAAASELPYMRANVARSITTLNAAAALLESETRRIGDASRAGRAFTVEERAAVRANCTWVVKQSRAVINELCDQSGTSSFFVQSDLQRFHREVNVMSSHSFYDFDRMLDVYGRGLFGLDIPAGELI